MKKAQAAMEFMMTYGWTILVIILAGGALVYFDVLNPGKFLPDTCNLEGFLCTDFQVTANQAVLYLTNNIGDDITVDELTIGTITNETDIPLQLGKSYKFPLDGSFGTAGDRYKATIKIKYSTTTSGISHTNVGEIATTIEAS